MKSLAILLLITAVLGCGKAAPVNELPLYGGQKKTDALKRVDDKFIEAIVRETGSREKGAEHFINRGWEAIAKHDPQTAIKRLNQAWLLNPDNGEIYWGLGAATAMQSQFEESIRLFEKANALLPNNANLLCDFANAYLANTDAPTMSAVEKEALTNKGLTLLEQAKKINSDLGAIYFWFSVSYYNKNDFKGAWENVHLAREKGYNSIDPQFLKALEEKMPNPQK